MDLRNICEQLLDHNDKDAHRSNVIFDHSLTEADLRINQLAFANLKSKPCLPGCLDMSKVSTNDKMIYVSIGSSLIPLKEHITVIRTVAHRILALDFGANKIVEKVG